MLYKVLNFDQNISFFTDYNLLQDLMRKGLFEVSKPLNPVNDYYYSKHPQILNYYSMGKRSRQRRNKQHKLAEKYYAIISNRMLPYYVK